MARKKKSNGNKVVIVCLLLFGVILALVIYRAYTNTGIELWSSKDNIPFLDDIALRLRMSFTDSMY